jgi:hypothetical protein
MNRFANLMVFNDWTMLDYLDNKPVWDSGSICRDISEILKINLAPVKLSKILRSISS